MSGARTLPVVLALAAGALPLGGCALVDPPRPVDAGGLVTLDGPAPLLDPPTSLRVVSWNIEHSRHVDRALAEIEADPRLRGADVYLFQEITREAVPSLAEGLEREGAHFVASVRERSGKEFGNTVLSRWPVLRAQRVDLPGGGQLTGSPRIATVVDLDVAGTAVRTVSVHTSTFVLSPDERAAQIRALLDAIADFDGPLVVGGDFNTFERQDVVELRAAMRAYGLEAVFTGTRGSIARWWRAMLSPFDQLDHVFVRGLDVDGAGTVVTTGASDHRAVWARLGWPPTDRGGSRSDRQGP